MAKIIFKEITDIFSELKKNKNQSQTEGPQTPSKRNTDLHLVKCRTSDIKSMSYKISRENRNQQLY